MSQACIFCKITKKEIPADIVYEDDKVMIFKDIHPSAPIHYLSVPKEHVESIVHLGDNHQDLIASIIYAAKKVAAAKGLKGYKLVFNVGREGGQVVDHLHLHLLGGWNKNEGNRLPHPSLDN